MQILHAHRLFEGMMRGAEASRGYYAFQLREWLIEPSAAMMKQR
mgnify:CR=1 FL=1